MKKTLMTLAIILSLMGIVAVPVYGAADAAQGATDSVCAGIGATAGGGICTAPAGTPDINKTIAVVINILSVTVGLIAVIMIIIGGIKYITSSGDSNNVASAKNTIIYAIVGLVVVAFAQIIVKFVLSRVSKT